MKIFDLLTENFSQVKRISISQAQDYPVWHEDMFESDAPEYDPDEIEAVLNLLRVVDTQHKEIKIVGASPIWMDGKDACVGIIVQAGNRKAGMSWWAIDCEIAAAMSYADSPTGYKDAIKVIDQYIRYLAQYHRGEYSNSK